MPTPSSALTTLRPDLASFMEFDLAADRNGFIASRIMPVIEVSKASGTFGKVTLESLLQSRETKRAPGSGYNRQNWEFTEDSYATVEHGAEEPVDDKEAELYADYFDAEVISTQRARDVVLRNYEERVCTAVSGVAAAATTSTAWTTVASATPLADIETQVQALYDLGIDANALIVSWKTFRNLRRTDEIKDLIAASGAGDPNKPGSITPAKLAEVMDLDYVLVAGARKNSANPKQSASVSSLWPDAVACVTRVATTNDMREPCLGRTFHWGQDGSMFGATVESYRDETVRSNIIRARMETDEKILYTEAIRNIDLTP